MLPFEITEDHSAVEVLFCEPFEHISRLPMDKETNSILFKLLFSDNQVVIPEKEKPFLMQVIEKRIEYAFTFKITDSRMILFLCLISETPGAAVMYLTYLQYWCKKHGRQKIDLGEFCERIFPVGFPARKDMQQLWDSVKVNREGRGGSDNLLDYQSAMKSIQFESEKVA